MKNYLPQIITFFIIFSIIGDVLRDDPRPIPDIKEPIQINLTRIQQNHLKTVKKLGGWGIWIVPLAQYEISGRVINMSPYFYGVDAVVAPYDIGVVWGRFKEDMDFKNLKTTYGTRTLDYKLYDNSIGMDYLISHIANIHVVPKNNEILKTIRKLKKGDDIYLKGYLVRAEGKNSQTGEIYSRGTSLSRTDTGNGACETMYVTDLIFHHRRSHNSAKSKSSL